MRAVVTRVAGASVTIAGNVNGRIGRGFLVLLGVGPNDTEETADRLAEKICNLRVFEDENGKMNLNLEQTGGALLVVSQFTLYADTSSRRPGFTGAAKPDAAIPLYERFMAHCRERGFDVQHGEFGADMQVDSRNDGPVTIRHRAALMREAAQGGGEMAPPELVRTFYETVVSQHRLEDLPRFVEEGCVLRQGEWTTPLGPGGMVRHLAALRETYPDYTVRILRQHWAAPYVVSECVMEGTHLGPWPGTVPTGKRLIFTGVNIDRVEGGKIVEHGGAVNTFETLWDAGMIRPAE